MNLDKTLRHWIVNRPRRTYLRFPPCHRNFRPRMRAEGKKNRGKSEDPINRSTRLLLTRDRSLAVFRSRSRRSKFYFLGLGKSAWRNVFRGGYDDDLVFGKPLFPTSAELEIRTSGTIFLAKFSTEFTILGNFNCSRSFMCSTLVTRRLGDQSRHPILIVQRFRSTSTCIEHRNVRVSWTLNVSKCFHG